MRKSKLLSILLSLCMVVTLMPTGIWANEGGYEHQTVENTPVVQTGEEHSNHPICGENCLHDGKHSGVTWIGVNSLNNKMQTGYYYLTADVYLDEVWKPEKDIVLCLNGHDVTANCGGTAININKTFTLTDCKRDGQQGKITHGEDGNGNKKIGGGVYVGNGKTFNMYGGSIANNKNSSFGSGVYVSKATFNMYGGSITNNIITNKNGGGVYVSGNEGSIFNVSGNVNISGNVKGGTFTNGILSGGTANNVYLNSGRTINITGKLADNNNSEAKVGVTLASDYGNSVFTNGWKTHMSTADPTDCFTADENNKEVVLDSNEAKLLQIHKHTVCVDADTCTDPEHKDSNHGDELTWKPIGSADELNNITKAGNYYLMNDIELSNYWTPADGVVLCLNGHDIKANLKGPAITINATFAMTDCMGSNANNGKITRIAEDKKYRGVSVDSGTFNMYGGEISGHKNSGVVVNSGTFEMYGGTITQNGDTSNNNRTRGSVCVKGTFKMHGGIITKNNVVYGGGVYVDDDGTFEMDGGTVSENKAIVPSNALDNVYGGGGVYVNSGMFTMKNGTITGNKAESYSCSVFGGGVYVDDDGTFEMDGGTIRGNEAMSSVYNTYGGGVFVKNGEFTMTNGSITGNNANASSNGGSNGGGVYVASGGTLTILGTAKISDNVMGGTKGTDGKYTGGTVNNVYLPSGKTITIGEGGLTNGASVGVTLADRHSGIFTSGWKGKMSDAKPTDYFTSDDRTKEVVLDSNEAKLITHVHKWKYTLNADTITATCSGTNCGTSGGSVTIKAPADLTYNGEAKAATVTGGFTNGESMPNITYKVKTENGNDENLPEGMDTPVNVGTYIASIKVGGVTASVTYTIGKANLDVSGTGTASGTYGQKLIEVTINGLTATANGNEVAGTWTLIDEYSDTLNTVTSEDSTVEYTAVFTPTDTTNYNTAEGKVNVTIAPKEGGSLGTVNLTQRYTDTSEKTYKPDWTGLPAGENWAYNSEHTTTGNVSVSNSGFDVDGKALTYTLSGGQVGDTVTFTLKAICGGGHYEPFTITLVVTIDKGSQSNSNFKRTNVITKDKVTTAPAEVKNETKTDEAGNKVTTATATVSDANQKEIIKQVKDNKSEEIIINVSEKDIADGASLEINLDKEFIDSIVNDTDAKLTIKTPAGDMTFTKEELKKLSEASTGDTITIDPTDDDSNKAEKIAKAKELIAGLDLTARSGKTAKGNVNVVLKNSAKTKDTINELEELGFTVKYHFYRSTKKSSGYKSTLTKDTASYTNTKGKKGTKYYYKVRVMVYDADGNLVAESDLKQCSYAARTWSK